MIDLVYIIVLTVSLQGTGLEGDPRNPVLRDISESYTLVMAGKSPGTAHKLIEETRTSLKNGMPGMAVSTACYTARLKTGVIQEIICP